MRKFDFLSLWIVVISLVILGVGALLFGSFGNEFGDDLRTVAYETMGENTNTQVATDFISNDTKNFADNFFFWFLIASFIGVLIMGMFLEFEPVTMIIIFIVGIILVGFAFLGSQIYEGFEEDVEGSEDMTKTNALLSSNYFPIFIFVALIIMVVIMYNRKRGIEA